MIQKIELITYKALYAHSLEKTAKFYRNYFDLDPEFSNSNYLEYPGGISYKLTSPWVVYIDEQERRISLGNRKAEIVFTCSDYQLLRDSLFSDENARIIVPERVDQSQRYFRLYDPDNHIIEIQEDLT